MPHTLGVRNSEGWYSQNKLAGTEHIGSGMQKFTFHSFKIENVCLESWQLKRHQDLDSKKLFCFFELMLQVILERIDRYFSAYESGILIEWFCFTFLFWKLPHRNFSFDLRFMRRQGLPEVEFETLLKKRNHPGEKYLWL